MSRCILCLRLRSLLEMFTHLTSAIALSLSVLFTTGARGHGYVQDVAVGSTHYTGYLPYTDPYYNPPPQRIIRKIPGNSSSFVHFSVSLLQFRSQRTFFIVHLGPVTDLNLIGYVIVFSDIYTRAEISCR